MSTDEKTRRERAIESVAKEMMRGLDDERYKKATPEEIEQFTQRYLKLIEEIFPHIPRDFNIIGAVVCKCALKYDKKRAIEFLTNFRDSLFQGREDPVFLFRRWFDSKHRRIRDREQLYKTTLMACRAFCEHREFKEIRSRITRDLFEWDADWDYPESKSKKKTSSSEKIKS